MTREREVAVEALVAAEALLARVTGWLGADRDELPRVRAACQAAAQALRDTESE